MPITYTALLEDSNDITSTGWTGLGRHCELTDKVRLSIATLTTDKRKVRVGTGRAGKLAPDRAVRPPDPVILRGGFRSEIKYELFP